VSPLKLFATTRSGQDLGLESNHATRSVIYPKLDISDRSSVRDFAKEVTQYGSVDVLINNAGINVDNEYSAANAKKTMEVNYTAMLDVSAIASFSHEHRLTGQIADVPNIHPTAVQERTHCEHVLHCFTAKSLQPRDSSTLPGPARHRRDFE
jgi:carbonyl reductase 1